MGNKWEKWKIERLKKEINKKREELAILQEEIKKKEIDLTGLLYDLGQLTRKEV